MLTHSDGTGACLAAYGGAWPIRPPDPGSVTSQIGLGAPELPPRPPSRTTAAGSPCVRLVAPGSDGLVAPGSDWAAGIACRAVSDAGRNDAARDVNEARVRIKVREHGPLLVTGPVELFDHQGRSFRVERPDVALCRCGRSASKPFCDGSHRQGFDGTCAPESYAG